MIDQSGPQKSDVQKEGSKDQPRIAQQDAAKNSEVENRPLKNKIPVQESKTPSRVDTNEVHKSDDDTVNPNHDLEMDGEANKSKNMDH